MNDDAVYSSIASIKLALKSANYVVQTDDSKILDYMTSVLDENWSKWVDLYVDSMRYGYNFNEVIYKLEDYWYPVEYRDTTLTAIEVDRDENGNTQGFINKYKNTKFPISKSLWFTWGSTFQNPYGKSFLKQAYKNWHNKQLIEMAMVNCSQRTGDPPFIIEHPIKMKQVGNTKVDQGRADAKTIADDWMDNKYILIPSVPGDGPKWAFSQMEMDDKQDKFIPLITQQDTSIFRALLMPDTLFSSGNAGTGSYALSGTQAELRAQFLDGIGKSLIENLTNEQTGLINTLMKLNFGVNADSIKINIESFDSSAQELYRALVEQAQKAPSYAPIDIPKLLEHLDVPVDEDFEDPQPEQQSFMMAKSESDKLISVNHGRATKIDNNLQELYEINKPGIIKSAYEPLEKWLSSNANKYYRENKSSPSAAQLGIPSEYIANISDQWNTVLMVTFLYGQKYVNALAARRLTFETDIMREWWEQSPEEVINIFRNLGVYPSNPAELMQTAQKKAFSLAIANESSIARQFQSSLTRAISKGVSQSAWVADVQKNLIPGLGLNEQKDYYLKTVYRNNTSSAFAAGQYSAYQDDYMKERFPAWQYCAVDDVHTRTEHEKNDGVILPIDDPWWDDNYPPNGHNCRCYVIQIYKDDLKGLKKKKPDGNSFDKNWNQNVGVEWVGKLI